MMEMRGKRARLGVLAFAVAGLVATLGSFVRIPLGEVGIAGERVLGPGWHGRVPFRAVPRLPQHGDLALDSLAFRTREGSDLVFRLDLAYRIGTKLAPSFARDVRADGLDGAVGALARHVLREAGDRSDAESLLSNSSLVEAPLAAALESSGVGVVRLGFHSPLGDELLRRRASESARALVRPPLGKVLLIGWDGADWEVIRPLVAAGRMPHLARLLERGAHGNLRSYDPMFSPLIWTTMATGKAPTEHGIADFVVKDASSGSRRPITSDYRKVKALWNVFSDFQRRSAWVAWWASYPAEPIDGVIVSDVVSSSLIAGGPDGVARLDHASSPDDFLRQRRQLLAPIPSVTRSDVERFFPVSDADWRAALEELATPRREGTRTKGEEAHQSAAAFVCRVLSATRSYHALAEDLLEARVPLVAVYYEGVDMMGHRFQHYLPPKMNMVDATEFERFQHAVTRFYEYQDELLGDLLGRVDRDTIVMIVSDHGFLSGAARPEGVLPFTSVQPAEWHRDWGIVVIAGPGIRAGSLPPTSVYDVAPTLLYLQGLPLAEDMPGRLIEAAFDPSLLRTSPLRSIRSYELVGAPRDRAAGAMSVDPAAMEEMMANLRALGYVGGDTQPAAAEAATTGEEKTDTQVYYHRNLAVSYIKQGRLREAEAELLAANQRKKFGKTYSMLSEVRASQGRYDDAARAIEEGWTEARGTMDNSSPLWLVELRLMAGDRPGAAAALSRWSSTMSPAARTAAEGRIADASGDTEAAAALYRRALDEDPLLVRVVQRLQEIDAAAGRPAALEAFLLETLEAHAHVDVYWDLVGQIAMARGDPRTALDRFRRALDLQPENGVYIGHYASAATAAGRAADARQALAWAERFPPREGSAWMALGSAWDRLGETDRAVAAFEAAGRSGLTGPGADLGAALALARAGRRDEARRRLDDASRRFPDNPAVRELRTRLQ
jgi:tetratricopeptide (TPR) repeat protein/predicted AlkP superfamily pyrophosphatase or phosphodiesterase